MNMTLVVFLIIVAVLLAFMYIHMGGDPPA